MSSKKAIIMQGAFQIEQDAKRRGYMTDMEEQAIEVADEWDEEKYPSECLNCGAPYGTKHDCSND